MKRFKIKLSSFLSFALATVLGSSLFWVSQQVQQLEREQRELVEQIGSENEGIRVLSAEWDYLNRPDRIEALAAKYLKTMTPVTPDNLLVNARAVPEPQVLQGEDDSPVLVSTGDVKEKKEGDRSVPAVSAAPEPRPIRDSNDLKLTDFGTVLKNTTGEDE